MIRTAGRFLSNDPQAMLERASQRAPGMVDHPGLKQTPTDMKRRAAILALQERKRAASSPAERLMADAQLEEANASLKAGQAAHALTQKHHEVVAGSRNPEGLSGFGTSSINEPVTQRLQAITMGHNKALSGSIAPKGYDSFGDRPLDPRLTQQGRNQFERIGAERAGLHQKYITQAMSAADTEARNMRERQRMQREGDAWLADQQRRGQALTALATR